MDIKYEKRIVAFIDILGFSKLVKESAIKEKKHAALIKLNAIYDIFEYTDFKILDEVEVTQFSDNIVVSIPYNIEDGAFYFSIRLQNLIRDLADKGISCRGGITIGELYHKGNTIFGPALVDAYMLESKVANYPRVIVGPDIIKIAKTYKGDQNTEENIDEVFSKLLGYDSDGFHYIEYLNIETEFDDSYEYATYLHNILSMIEEGLKSPDITIRAKYTWLGLKYNAIIMRLEIPGAQLAKIEHLIITGVNDKYK